MAYRGRAMVVLGVAGLVGLAACRLFVDLDGLTDGEAPADAGTEAAVPVDAGADAEVLVDAADAAVPSEAGDASSTCPAGMVVAGLTVKFCIDATEVTNGQYDAFLASAPSTAAQPSVCAWNTTFAPGLSGGPTYPVRALDWCDARAYCAYAGKRLCGKVGGGSLTNDTAVSGASEWTLACTGGTNEYPYGSMYSPTACVGQDSSDGGGPQPVGSRPGCVGSVPGLFDMSGNVFEFQDSCVRGDGGPESDLCATTGGDYGEDAIDMRCAAREVHPRAEVFPWRGFRCCRDL